MPVPSLSFEIFPPASVQNAFKLWDCMAQLQGFQPDFLSVTYGAQGGAQDRTLDTVKAVMDQTGLPVAAHLTAARASKEEVLARAKSFANAGIDQIVALRGDPDAAGADFVPHPNGFSSSLEMIAALSKLDLFKIRIGAYPEGHPSSTSLQQNIDYLKAKFDAGADEAITQFFFEPDTFLRFRDACEKAGIEKPIHPGILPIGNWERARSFAKRCGASVPQWLDRAFQVAIRDDRADLLSLAVTTELSSKLLEEGVPHLHIYTLNSARLTGRLCAALGVEPVQVLRNVA